MLDLTIARALHVIAVVHWIGGVFMVTAVILPAVGRIADPRDRVALFEAVEGRFARQAKISVTLAGLTGFYMTHRLDAWGRFADPGYWWMHAMTLVWIVFTFVLFVAEPLFLHRWFRRRAESDPDAVFQLMQRFHWALLCFGIVTAGAGVLGAHGLLF
jgi:uncharacterized membrane protein